MMILDVNGDVDPGPAELVLGAKVHGVLACGYRKILLNLAGMTSSNASAINALLGALRATREAGAELKLSNVGRRLKSLLILVALHRHFEVFDSEQGAVTSLRSGSPVPEAAGRSLGASMCRAIPAG